MTPWPIFKLMVLAYFVTGGNNGVPRRKGAKDMDMVWTHLHFFNGDVILLRNIGKELLHPVLDLSISALTVGAVQDLNHHDATLVRWGFSTSPPLIKGSRSTPLKHLRPL